MAWKDALQIKLKIVEIKSESIFPQLSVHTPPGTKVLLLGKLAFKQGYIQVGPKDLKVLGGSVAKLVEKWEANRLVEMTGRVYSGQVYCLAGKLEAML